MMKNMAELLWTARKFTGAKKENVTDSRIGLRMNCRHSA